MLNKKMLSIIFSLLVVSCLCACGDTVKEYAPSNLYNNKEDKDYNKQNKDDVGYMSGDTNLDVLPDADDVTPTPTPIEIKTTVELTPTPTIEEESKEYTCYSIKQDDFIVYVPLIGEFVEARQTENFVPTNNENEISMFWADSEDLILTTVVIKKNDEINETYFDNYFNNLNTTYKENINAKNLNYSEKKTSLYGEYTINFYSINVDIMENNIWGHHMQELCVVEKDGYYIYSLLRSSLGEPPVIIESIIDVMYPIILDYESEIIDDNID